MQLVVHSPSAAASTAPGAWRCASASAASSTSSCRRRRPRTTSCCRSPTAHSFPLDDVARYLHSATARDVLVQALLDAPMFGTRWRWDAGVSLALPRFRGGKKVPPQLARMDAEDLIGVGLPRPGRLRREPRRRARDPRPSAGRARRSTTACTRRWTSTAWSGCCSGIEAGAVARGRARPHRALAARARGADGAALRLSSTTRRSRSAAPRR